MKKPTLEDMPWQVYAIWTNSSEVGGGGQNHILVFVGQTIVCISNHAFCVRMSRVSFFKSFWAPFSLGLSAWGRGLRCNHRSYHNCSEGNLSLNVPINSQFRGGSRWGGGGQLVRWGLYEQVRPDTVRASLRFEKRLNFSINPRKLSIFCQYFPAVHIWPLDGLLTHLDTL